MSEWWQQRELPAFQSTGNLRHPDVLLQRPDFQVERIRARTVVTEVHYLHALGDRPIHRLIHDSMNVFCASSPTKRDRAITTAVMPALPYEASRSLVSFQFFVDPFQERTTSTWRQGYSSTRPKVVSSSASALTTPPLTPTILPHNNHQVLTLERVPMLAAESKRRSDARV